MNTHEARRAHRILDTIAEELASHPDSVVGTDDLATLRELLPERPAQKTLTEIYHMVDEAWKRTEGDEFNNSYSPREWVDAETWLLELRTQISGVISRDHLGSLTTLTECINAPVGTVIISAGEYPMIKTGRDSWEDYARVLRDPEIAEFPNQVIRYGK